MAANSPAPGYIQSLISKIVNNDIISNVCNNMILKYLEEDNFPISLNARTVTLSSVENKWKQAFTGNTWLLQVN